jgi:hypothetical protein
MISSTLRKLLLLLFFLACSLGKNSYIEKWNYPSSEDEFPFIPGKEGIQEKYFTLWCSKNCKEIQIELEKENVKILLIGKHDATELPEEGTKLAFKRAEALKKRLCIEIRFCDKLEVTAESDKELVLGKDKFDPYNRVVRFKILNQN